MNIFVLNTGRCGSTTFIRACQHIENFTALHESRATLMGAERLNYPENHIEADNRLSWLLGRLERQYGDRAFYVHLNRDPDKTAASFARRQDFGIMKAYREGILMQAQPNNPALELARDYIDTVDSNIELFLKDKSHTLSFSLENAQQDFTAFWHRIHAQGDLKAALAEWAISYNASV